MCEDRSGGDIVLVEVKTRVRSGPGDSIDPTVAIHPGKRRRLVRTAEALARLPRFTGRHIRIDVVTLEYGHIGDRAPRFRHYVNAVAGDGSLR